MGGDVRHFKLVWHACSCLSRRFVASRHAFLAIFLLWHANFLQFQDFQRALFQVFKFLACFLFLFREFLACLFSTFFTFCMYQICYCIPLGTTLIIFLIAIKSRQWVASRKLSALLSQNKRLLHDFRSITL